MVLESSNISYSYPGGTPMSFPDIALDAGETGVVLGNSGKGKTTLLHIICGILRAPQGSVIINGTDITQLKTKKLDRFRGKNLGIVFQQSYFLPYLNLEENLLFSQKVANHYRDSEEVSKLLAELDVENLKKKKPSECSVGEQQRASIARALLFNPKLILADEPTSALDDDNAERVAKLLKNSSQNHGAALLVVTHDNRLKQHFSKTITL